MNIVIVDANSILCPHFFYFFARGGSLVEALDSVLEDMKLVGYGSSHYVTVFDPPKKLGPTIRKQIYPEYKAGRQSLPPEINTFKNMVWKSAKELSMNPWYLHPYEADDVVASMAKSSIELGFTVDVYSRDKDLCQCMCYGPKVSLVEIKLEGGERTKFSLNRDSVYNKYGVYPEQMMDYLSMMGDSSDNIPGIASIGKETAKKLLNIYGDWNSIYAAANDGRISGRVGTIIKGAQDAYELSMTLVKPIDNIALPFPIDNFKRAT